MANNSVNVGVANSWSLTEFARAFGPTMKVTNELVNSNTGETFKSCAFITPAGKVTLVGFASKLGVLTPNEIVRRQKELQVVELESGNFKLCQSGADAWETVNLSL